MNANQTLLQKKFARIIELYAEKYNTSPETALDRFYKSDLYHQIKGGISDLHCMSDEYLADELNDEWSPSRYYEIEVVRQSDDRITLRFTGEEDLKLSVLKIAVFDQNDECMIDLADAVDVRISEGKGVFERTIPNSNSTKCNIAQFIVKDETHREQYSYSVLINGTGELNSRRMVYDER